MTKEVPELLLLDAVRNYRERFELRFAKSTEAERMETAKAVVECASALSRYLGRMPDNIVFGRDVFTHDQAEQLLSGLHDLQGQAEARDFASGVTAVLALQAVASLVLARHIATFKSSHERRERELTRMGGHMEKLVEIYGETAEQ